MLSIYDMPVRVFHQVIETGNIGLVFYRKARHIHAKRIRRIPGVTGKVWENLNSQIIKEFGVSKEFEQMFFKQRDINNLEIQALVGDRSAEFFIKTYQADLDRMQGQMVKVTDYRKYHAKLHRALTARYGRDSHSLTIFEFYNDLFDLQKESEDRELQVVHNGTNG